MLHCFPNAPDIFDVTIVRAVLNHTCYTVLFGNIPSTLRMSVLRRYGQSSDQGEICPC